MCRPAWRNNQTGARSTCSPRASLNTKSFAGACNAAAVAAHSNARRILLLEALLRNNCCSEAVRYRFTVVNARNDVLHLGGLQRTRWQSCSIN